MGADMEVVWTDNYARVTQKSDHRKGKTLRGCEVTGPKAGSHVASGNILQRCGLRFLTYKMGLIMGNGTFQVQRLRRQAPSAGAWVQIPEGARDSECCMAQSITITTQTSMRYHMPPSPHLP